MKKEGASMINLLKIKDEKGYFLKDDEYKLITLIDREDILKHLNYIVDDEVTLDNPYEQKISNEAQKLIYEDLYKQYIETQASKNDILDEIDELFKEKLSGYKILEK